LHYESGKLCRTFIRAHPTRDECLVASHRQAEDGVVDAILRLTRDGLTAVPYTKAPGFPVEMPAVARYNLEPFYSWDGESIIVPLHQGGLTVLPVTGGEARFIPYPPLPFATTGQALGAVYSPDNRSLVYASFWRLEYGTQREIELCSVYLFDIASGEQLRQIELSWPVYQIASADPVNMLWLARGSRYPNKQTEFRRVPRLALLDPDSGKVKLQVFGGRPYWPVVLATRGARFTYLDQRRGAIVRLDRETGAIDIDPRCYSESAQLFITADGEVYAWDNALLFRAEFSEHEQSLEYGGD